MPPVASLPGVYVAEVASGTHNIAAAPTSIAAFVGRAARGPLDEPTAISSFADFERLFGGLSRLSPMSYAVSHFFLNGGAQALIVRVANNAVPATLSLPAGPQVLILKAHDAGAWGNDLQAQVNLSDGTPNSFDLLIIEKSEAGIRRSEQFPGLSLDAQSDHFIGTRLEASALVELAGPPPDALPDATDAPLDFAGGEDGGTIGDAQIAGPDCATAHRGLFALDKAGPFNLLVIPPLDIASDLSADARAAALRYAAGARALYLLDVPLAWSKADHPVDALIVGIDALIDRSAPEASHGALYFPAIRAPDPLDGGREAMLAPGGAVAGVIARTDAARGVWAAPAGVEASLTGVTSLGAALPEVEIGRINPLGFNGLRQLPGAGMIVWGARTLAGADALASMFKYVPVRRTHDFIATSVQNSLQWVVFEPNAEPLWAAIRQSVGAFMTGLFQQGAFAGTSTKEAWFVKCDAQTMTATDIVQGRVNLLIGFAPLKPAEFVTIQLSIAASVQTPVPPALPPQLRAMPAKRRLPLPRSSRRLPG